MNFKKIIANQAVRSLIFWTASFILLLKLFSRTDEIRVIDIIYTSLFHVPLILGIEFHQFSISRFLEKKKYGHYLITVLLILVLIPQIYFVTYNYLADLIFQGYYFVAVYEWFEISGIGFIYLVLTLLLYLAQGWFKQQENITKLALLEEEKTTSELQALRAQVNPHFLFNSLNTIYGEAIKKSDKAPDLILGLSDILRYVVDNMNKDVVPLQSEFDYIRKYVTLQKERLNNPGQVLLTIEDDSGDYVIPPLLLITFIENCFKHGQLTEESDRITISISLKNHKLTLETMNSIGRQDEEFVPETYSKTGLMNARRRLDLVYGETYTLEIKTMSNQYLLHLTIHLAT